MDVVKHPAQNCFYETKTPEPAKVRESAFRGGDAKAVLLNRTASRFRTASAGRHGFRIRNLYLNFGYRPRGAFVKKRPSIIYVTFRPCSLGEENTDSR